MAANLSLKLSNRGRKGQVKKLPESIHVPKTATVEDVKMAIAQQAKVGDFNRIGLFDPTTKKLLRDRKSAIGSHDAVASKGELLVQDLGLQMGWRTVFLIEYFGPILIHGLFYYLGPYISLPYFYTNADKAPAATDIQQLLFVLFQIHFVKRELETAFLHKFAANTMPAFNIFRNSAFYWLVAGLLSAFSIYATWSPFRFPAETRSGLVPLDYVGLALFACGEVCNFAVHYHLAGLRRPGTTEKGIPSCIGSSLVTSPNYMFEVMAWVGVILISRDLFVVLFILIGISYMRSWSRDKERDLRQRFPDKYKKKRYTMLPGLI